MALELPCAVRAALAQAAGAVSDPGLRPIAAEDLHLTLCFLGSQPASALPEIAAACEVATRHPAPLLRPRAPLWLPRRRSRVLAVALAEDGDRLGRLQASLSAALAGAGWYRPEDRPFLPHVTIARVRHGQPVRPERVALAATPQHFWADSVALTRSQLGPGGARYLPLHRVHLAAG